MKKIILTLLVLSSFSFISVAQSIRNFSATNLNNEVVTIDELAGEKFTVIDFWASWCKPCLKAMPKLENIFQSYQTKGINVVGVNVDGPRSLAKVKPIINSLRITYPVLTDLNNRLMNDMEVGGLPTLIIVDSELNIIHRHEGYVKGDEIVWQKEIDELLNK